MLTVIVICAVLLGVFHFGGKWVRSRCEELDFGLGGPSDTAPRSSS